MSLRNSLLFLLLLSASVYPFGISYAQPVWSPEVRSEREMQWMQDSLHISPDQYKKISEISLNYQRNMDKVAQPANKHSKDKMQKKLMQKKDADLKALLNNEQYQKYYRREKQIRKQAKIVYP